MTNIDNHTHTQTNTQCENIITSLSRVYIKNPQNGDAWHFVIVYILYMDIFDLTPGIPHVSHKNGFNKYLKMSLHNVPICYWGNISSSRTARRNLVRHAFRKKRFPTEKLNLSYRKQITEQGQNVTINIGLMKLSSLTRNKSFDVLHSSLKPILYYRSGDFLTIGDCPEYIRYHCPLN